jgi:hypothetical protein
VGACVQSAWKFSNPTDPAGNPDCPKDAKDYEKVVRYNYSKVERTALVEVRPPPWPAHTRVRVYVRVGCLCVPAHRMCLLLSLWVKEKE